ncbi:MAG: response regulator [Ignavibacteria bacterium]|nr:response regulator [Ignavibacteria bacterium]
MVEDCKGHILVVDDEEALRTAVRRILEMEGFEVKEAHNGSEGISFGTTTEYDLALIDLKMPDRNGIEVLKEIRHTFPNTVCFMATAYASYETAVEATKLGADGYILKPFSPDELINQLNSGIRKRKLLLETERLKKEREESLLEVAFERTRLKTIINSITDGVIVINKKEELAYFNQAALKLLDVTYLPLGIPVTEHFPIEVAQLLSEKFFEVEEQQSSFSIEVEIKPNNELILEATFSPILQADGKLAGVVVVLKNITEFKRLELIKSQFVSMVAHELKAPIAASIGFIDIMRKPELNISQEQQIDFLNRTHGRLQSLLTMVNDLLDISRMELNKVTREIKEVIVEETIAEVAGLFTVELQKKDLTLSLPGPDEKHIIKVDQNEFLRLLTNLVSNAIKYNKEHGTIYITVKADAYYTVISVRDTGIGLRPEDKDRLFSEFFRAKNEFTKNIHGTGLGLSIVKRIIEAYSGKIECQSTYGEGTEFIISFPVIPIEQA